MRGISNGNGPHRMVDGVVDSVAGGVKSAVSGAFSATTRVGEDIQRGLDTAPKSILGVESPTRVVGDVLDGVVGGVENAITMGVIESPRKVGKGIMNALDRPLKQLDSAGLSRILG